MNHGERVCQHTGRHQLLRLADEPIDEYDRCLSGTTGSGTKPPELEQ